MGEEALAVLRAACKAIDDKFGAETVALDIGKISDIADHMVITSANNPNQLSAIMDNVDFELSKLGVHPRHVEGASGSRWMLMDYGDLIVHLFCGEERNYYNLERIWADAARVETGLPPAAQHR